jgi:hypothetical protein
VLQLVAEFPDLRAREAHLRRAMQALAADPDYRLTLYSREMVPKTYAGFDRWPEFACLEGVMPGYQARPALEAAA